MPQQQPTDLAHLELNHHRVPMRLVDLKLKHRHVLPIFSYDHPRHKEVVVQFCRFLQRHMRCDVSLPDWQRSVGPTVEMWLTKEIERADTVLLLCSKGTGLKYHAKAERQDRIPTDSLSEYGDVFVKALTLLDDYFGRRSADEKFVVAYFNYSSQDDIPVTFRRFATFRLMQCMEALYLRIHGKARDSPLSHRRVPELDRYQELEMGRPLYVAIESMKELIRTDASWYENQNRRHSSEMSGSLQSEPCEAEQSSMTEAPSWFFDENSSGRGSDADKYEEMLSQFNSLLPSTQATGSPESPLWEQGGSSSMPDPTFPSACSETVDSGFTDCPV